MRLPSPTPSQPLPLPLPANAAAAAAADPPAYLPLLLLLLLLLPTAAAACRRRCCYRSCFALLPAPACLRRLFSTTFVRLYIFVQKYKVAKINLRLPRLHACLPAAAAATAAACAAVYRGIYFLLLYFCTFCTKVQK